MSSPVQYLQKMLEKAAIHQKKEKFSDRLLKHSAFNTQTNNKPAVSSQQQLGSLEAPENKPLTNAPITQSKPITQSVAQQPVQITGANQTHKAYSNPVRSSSPPKPPAPTQTTKIPNVLKVARATGIADADGNPYVNVEDVYLLGKLGFELSVEEYEGLEKSSEVLDLYSYIEKCAGVPKIPSQAVDRGEAFSAEYLKDMGYEVPKGYEVKGDLVSPIEKKAEEPLAPNILRLSNGTVINLRNLSYTARNRDIDYTTLTSPMPPSKEYPISNTQSSLTNEGNGWGGYGSPGIIKSPQYTYIDDTGKKVGVTTGYHRPVGDHGFDGAGRQIRHIVNYFSPNAEKIDLPETFAKEIYEHLGGDDFAKSIHLHDAEKLRNAWRERAKEKGFFLGKYPEMLVFDKHLKKALEDVVRTADDPAWANKTIGGPPSTLLQKLKPYTKPIGIGAGVTGLAALGYYLHNKNKEHTAQETPFTGKESSEKTAEALVVSGIHGDEPAGNNAAEKLKDSVDVVSDINPSKKRRFEGKDINRHFDKPTEGKAQKTILDIIRKKKPSKVIALHEDDEVDKPYAYSSESLKNDTREALKNYSTASSAHGDKTEDGVISEGKNPPDGSLEKALDDRDIPRVTLETPSKAQNIDKRVDTQLDVVRKLLNKKAEDNRPHHHLILRIEAENLPNSEKECNQLVEELAKEIDMKIVYGPRTKHLTNPETEGYSTFAIITTSHISLHTWNKTTPPLMQIDIFSCNAFSREKVEKYLNKKFKINKISDVFIDRTSAVKVKASKEKKAEADPAQTILITGHSGSGKSTLGKLLAEKFNLPLHRVDAQQDWDNLREHFENNPEQEHKALTPGTSEHRRYLKDIKKIVNKSLNEIDGPAILEGTQVTTLSPKQLAKYKANILVGGNIDQSIAQRLQRMSDKAAKKRISFTPEQLEKKKEESRLVANSWEPGISKFRQLPGVLHYNHTEHKIEPLIERLQGLLSKKAQILPEHIIGGAAAGLSLYAIHKQNQKNKKEKKALPFKKAEATHELKSSNIKAVGYDKKNKQLEIAFHSGGNYTYNDVPKSLFDRIKKVKSPGKFFHKHIKKDNKFEYNKLIKESANKNIPAHIRDLMIRRSQGDESALEALRNIGRANAAKRARLKPIKDLIKRTSEPAIVQPKPIAPTVPVEESVRLDPEIIRSRFDEMRKALERPGQNQ